MSSYRLSPIPGLVLLAALLPTGVALCQQQAFYVSPFNGNNLPYQTIPLHSDSARTAVYAEAAGFCGWANDLATDHFAGGRVSLAIARHQGMFEGYGGVNLTMGSYILGKWQGYDQSPFQLELDDKIYRLPHGANTLNGLGGPYSFGGVGFSGGFNAMVPIGKGEWRFLGVETALHEEFGNYLHLRQKMPDSLATYIVRQPFFGTLGLTTEWVFHTRPGEFGFRLAHGWTLGARYHPTGIYDSVSDRTLKYRYGSFSAHYTLGSYTLYFQAGTASKAFSVQAGCIFRLTSNRRI